MLKKLTYVVLLSILSYASTDEVNVYSHRHYDTDKQLFKTFTKQTGIKVNVVKAKANELIKRIEKESRNSPADILITSDAAMLHLANSKNLLQKVNSKILKDAIPKNLRQKDGYWFALTKRARVIVYNKDKISKENLSTYEALTSNEFKNQILVRGSNNIYNQSLLASIIENKGEKEKC